MLNANELLKRYAAGETHFSGANLTGINLSQADLIGIDLQEAGFALRHTHLDLPESRQAGES